MAYMADWEEPCSIHNGAQIRRVRGLEVKKKKSVCLKKRKVLEVLEIPHQAETKKIYIYMRKCLNFETSHQQKEFKECSSVRVDFSGNFSAFFLHHMPHPDELGTQKLWKNQAWLSFYTVCHILMS